MRTCENCSIRKQYAKCFDVHFDWRDCPYACEYAKEQVKEETEPIKHGKWISVPNKKDRICSVCEGDEPYKFADENVNIFAYCPYCGTKMDEDSQKMHSR